MLGLLDVWLYKSPLEPKRPCWVFHLKSPCDPERIDSDWIFYDKQKKDWIILDKEQFDENSNGLNYKRISYEDLLKDWEKILQYTDPPFNLNDIASCQLQVWAWSYSVNGSKEFIGPENYDEDDLNKKCPQEIVCWFFHLRNDAWVVYDFCENVWRRVDRKQHVITDKTCHTVPFNVLEREWQQRFSKQETKTPFKITDIMERKGEPPSYQI